MNFPLWNQDIMNLNAVLERRLGHIILQLKWLDVSIISMLTVSPHAFFACETHFRAYAFTIRSV